jgi:hypothetical protein
MRRRLQDKAALHPCRLEAELGLTAAARRPRICRENGDEDEEFDVDMDGELGREEDGGAAVSGQAHRGEATASEQGASGGAAHRRRGATW